MGYSFCRSSPQLTHILFEDDSFFSFFFLCKETEYECQKVLDIWEVYGRCLGQYINKNKTTIFFSKSTPETIRDRIKEALGFQRLSNMRNI